MPKISTLLLALTLLTPTPSLACDIFLRGDADTNNAIDISDPIFILSYLFTENKQPQCPEALDANGDNQTNLSDAVYLLNYLFIGGPQPPEPFPNPGSVCLPPEGFLPIKNADHLNAIAVSSQSLIQNYFLCNDITLTGPFAPIKDKTGDLRVDAFKGIFDGNSKKIINLSINRPEESRIGLFGSLHSGAVIRNLTLVNPRIYGRTKVGAFAGVNEGLIENCTIVNADNAPPEQNSFQVEGHTFVGGMVGWNASGTMNKVSINAKGLVKGHLIFDGVLCDQPQPWDGQSVGGLIGQSTGTYITDAMVGDQVVVEALDFYDAYHPLTCQLLKKDVPGGQLVGGLIGSASPSRFGTKESIILRSHSKASVRGADSVGGLVGLMNGRPDLVLAGKNDRELMMPKIIESSASGTVEGESAVVGGLVGRSDFAKIIRSTAKGNVSGKVYATGGLVGINSRDAIIENSYALGNVTGGSSIGGLAGITNEDEFIAENRLTKIINSYAYGLVQGEDLATTGGLVGTNDRATIENSYYNKSINGNLSDPRNEGRLDQDFKKLDAQNTFVGWDISAVLDNKASTWKLNQFVDPPVLSWELLPR